MAGMKGFGMGGVPMPNPVSPGGVTPPNAGMPMQVPPLVRPGVQPGGPLASAMAAMPVKPAMQNVTPRRKAIKKSKPAKIVKGKMPNGKS